MRFPTPPVDMTVPYPTTFEMGVAVIMACCSSTLLVYLAHTYQDKTYFLLIEVAMFTVYVIVFFMIWSHYSRRILISDKLFKPIARLPKQTEAFEEP